MSNKREANIIVLIVLFTISTASFFLFTKKETYTLNVPECGRVTSIVINSGTIKREVMNTGEVNDIIYVLKGNERSSKTESVNDYPSNIEKSIKLEFYFDKTEIATMFVYTRNNQYYIEEPYNGIYQMSGDEYNSIEKFVR